MKKRTLFYFLIFLFFQKFLVVGQVRIDTSAVSVFWEVVDTLSIDKMPSKKLWKRFANHPAYVQIEKSGNRITFLKKVLPIVFCPSNFQKLKKVLNGKKSFTQELTKHLQEIKKRRKELDSYLASGKIYSYNKSYSKSLKYLPKDIMQNQINLTIYIALFEDNGFGGKVITMDLLHLMKGSYKENLDFFAHEFHHALRRKTKIYKLFEPSESEHYPIIEALNKLPLEGVASLIDKRKYFSESYFNKIISDNNPQKETILEFRNLFNNIESNLLKIDSILISDLSIKEKEKEIFKNMPWSGHVIGFYMAKSIEDNFGRKKLIEVQYSCIDFILTYHKSSKITNSLFIFSDKTIYFLNSLKK